MAQLPVNIFITRHYRAGRSPYTFARIQVGNTRLATVDVPGSYDSEGIRKLAQTSPGRFALAKGITREVFLSLVK